jgi:hypothetical protein
MPNYNLSKAESERGKEKNEQNLIHVKHFALGSVYFCEIQIRLAAITALMPRQSPLEGEQIALFTAITAERQRNFAFLLPPVLSADWFMGRSSREITRYSHKLFICYWTVFV